MTEKDALELVRQAITRLNAGDVAGFTQLLSRDFFTHRPAAGERTAPEVIGALLTDLSSAVPDLAVALSSPATTDERVTATVEVTGTQTGSLWGVPALGKPHEHTIPIVARAEGGRLAFALTLEPPGAAGILRALELINPADQMHLPPKHPVMIPEVLLRLAFTGQMADKPCSHVDDIAVTKPQVSECKDCVASGDAWPALRMCLVCGYVGCCDTSVNTHMKRHCEATGHAIMRSIRLDEGWVWCYECLAFRDKPWLEARQAAR